MPLTQFICPDKERVTISQCLSGNCRMSNRCAPLGYLQLCARQRPWEGKASVTQLIDGTRTDGPGNMRPSAGRLLE